MNPVLKLIMKMNKLRFLLAILCMFTISLEASNRVSFGNISELESGNLKIVFNLDKVALINSYALDDPSRIVIDLKGSVYWKKPWQVKFQDRVDLILEIKRDKKISTNLRDIIVAIDAGHGGRDPGSVGKNILEKDVTLLIARELELSLIHI